MKQEDWKEWERSFRQVDGQYIYTGKDADVPGEYIARWVKKDCFAYTTEYPNRCNALRDSYCAKGHNCKFYKPKEVNDDIYRH